LVCALILAGLFYVIDHRVVARLNSLTTPKLPVIYSSPLDITGMVTRLGADSSEDIKIIRTALLDRRYSEVSGIPSRPGEFSVGPQTISIYSRAFTNFNGESVSARKESIPFKPDETYVSRHLYLEPQVVSYIGSADVRASSFVPLTQIPSIVQQSVISIEDERFYSHFGLDLVSIARAVMRNVLARRLVQGGSTLTQQLAKNLFLSPKRTFSRKLLEIPTALSLERHLSKNQLLELYLNEVYLGQEGAVAIHGMPEAASAFFGKKLEDLRVEEAATLAGMIKAPSSYNPRRYPERARERRDLVLQKLVELGHISAAEYSVAVKRPVRTVNQQEHRRLAPFYTSALESELSQSIDLDVAHATGLAVYTGLDLGMQECAERKLEAGLAALETSHPKLKSHDGGPQASLIAIEPHSGLVKAWVGGRDFSVSQFNRVNQSTRQIGSTVKPFLYLSALDGSLNSYKVATAASILEDKPMELQVNKKAWNPENYDHEFRGDVTLRYALEHSLNMPALYIAERIGISTLRRTLSLFRLAPQVSEVPALALGSIQTFYD
jgi:penicillin-binding protein 1B